MATKKPNIKLMNSVHTEARITTKSPILAILYDIDSEDYYYNRMIESIRMAKNDRVNADTHLCLVAQLNTILRTKLREGMGIKNGTCGVQESVEETGKRNPEENS